ncbi:disease resistance protein RUN1-like isoform X1 [Juglans regia]|uniref:Disease resistance protein RUN1-like isoform X1 n=1 Tax=Juglans regia TaxID=51240 RepID=A0A6P9EHQ3_JUGRE|nr:disease resistance protein RUN1-like isoform X1 [Juglans regia]XP_035546898.1 disease resistance protein RUN1-like isoform X1 [Juglans regia]XP_035546899.1 disease resistance protein RUN1-like isoform X1 [Juglans regia]XP_035546900.1 disease resistance protein RUN1-like isoform X1 [Juglans regia]XP_035546901.1 disease resistance protein RUN1-like isoform X1 [Juglans regia]XP_035546902.1 disease resistance protein RUN1-like isoform X1 [Juglans regia]XP_035546903.1 disease resistance protein
MAFQSGASSSSSPTSSPPIRSCNHDVFLSFRGEDVRGNFISHLYKVLVQRGINTYIDNNLERGEEISPVLFKAIEESMISIIVLSKNYAESRWCLDELLKILDCKETKKQIVLPIFFQVDPSEVRHQNGIFGKSFDKLGDKFKDNVKMLKWKEALEKVSHISGFSSAKFGNESECIEKIVQEVSSKLPNRTCLHVANYPIGLESHVEGINMLLCIEFINETRMIGIFGTGGIGKTTTAKEVYNCIADQFEGSCFLVNVSENSKPDKGGLVKLQKKILSDILRDPKVEVDDVDRGINMIQEKLCCKKVLLVLDDIDCLDQLEKLSGRSDWFGLGSRIIITTRDKHILVQHDVGNWIYPMNEMDAKDALKLFSWHAFKRDQPDNDFVELTELALQYAGGLPLALTVVGSNLRGRDIPFWRCELEKYQRIPHKKIYDILKISFDGLDDFEKDIFLDIACFFKGDKREYVTKILDSCGFFAYAGIKNLNDKCLITIDEHDRLMMHDLLEDMGKEIVRQESPKEPGKRSRLWFYEDVLEVLEKNKGTEQIEGILINLLWEGGDIYDDLPLDYYGIIIRFGSEVFAKMERLRILIVKMDDHMFLSFEPELNYLSNELRVLDLPNCSLEFLPSSFHGEKLIVFNISGKIRDLGTRLQSKNLTSMDLSCCYNLTNISDLSSCSNLQKLILSGCGSLVEVHDSVGFLNKLVELDFINCFNLKKLPRSFKLRCLVLLQLRGCKSLEYFPEIECKMEHLKCVEISSTVIQELPPSITNLIGLNMLYLQGCESLVHLPINIFQLERLKDVQIKDCPNFVNLVAEVGHNRQSMPCTQPPKSNNSLRTLNLSGSGIVSLSPCIEGFVGLSKLDLSYCRQLEEILHLPPNIEEVLAKRCSSLKNFLPESNNLFRTYNLSSSLKTLNLSFSGIVSLSPCIEGFVGLSKLNLSDCKQLEEILHLPPNIKEVDVRGCVLLERFPHVSTECSFGTPDLKRLTRINLSECNKVEVDVGNNAPDPLLVQEHFREKDSFRIIYPGSRIPEWFKYCKETTSFTNSIEIEIDHNASMCFGHQIVALVLCSVVGCYPMRFDQIIISINGQSMFNEYNNAISTDPHCVLLQYKVGSSIDRVLSRSYRKNNMRFEFRTISNNAIFKSVGVHLVYGN